MTRLLFIIIFSFIFSTENNNNFKLINFPFSVKQEISFGYEDNFMSGYNSLNFFSQKALNIMIVKEFFKHWKMAHLSLERKKWPKLLKLFLRKFYVDSFYKYLISNELQELSK